MRAADKKELMVMADLLPGILGRNGRLSGYDIAKVVVASYYYKALIW